MVDNLKKHLKNGRELLKCFVKIEELRVVGKSNKGFIFDKNVEINNFINESAEWKLIDGTIKTMKRIKFSYYWSFNLLQHNHMFDGYFDMFPNLVSFCCNQKIDEGIPLENSHYCDIGKKKTTEIVKLNGFRFNPDSFLYFCNIKEILLTNYILIDALEQQKFTQEIKIKENHVVNLRNLEVLALIGYYRFESECLIHLPNLKRLYTVCLLFNIPKIRLNPVHFKNLKKLNVLNLCQTYIFDSNSFAYLVALKELVLTCEHDINAENIHLIPKDITKLTIKIGSNFFLKNNSSINSRVFTTFKYIKKLSISHINLIGNDLNQLTVETIKLRCVSLGMNNFEIESLKELELVDCLIDCFLVGKIFKCRNLKKLTLKYSIHLLNNNQTPSQFDISDDVFMNLNKLEYLSLYNIPSITIHCLKYFRNLKKIKINEMKKDFISKGIIKYLNLNNDLMEVSISCRSCHNLHSSSTMYDGILKKWSDFDLDENESSYDDEVRKRKVKMFSFILSFEYFEDHEDLFDQRCGLRCRKCKIQNFSTHL